ncbi:MAG TPA: protein kinase [Thermoanaerobaculia bacterium]|jgi:serine/threonine-protein kinase
MPDKVGAAARLGKLGRYEVLNELGKGAMGIVYLAKDPVIGRMVAIKTIRTSQGDDDDSESREFRERFVREAQTAGILSHPNIVTIHDIGEDPESRTSFIAMEYIEGRNLKSLLADKKKFSWDEIADLIAQIAEALDYAHRKGIIHRDIKPANIILTTDGKIKITDFGIAKIASSNLTTTGQFLGTPNYMSPEQVSGAPVDGRSDIFSLGVVLYELLTNRKPFLGDNLTAISYKIVHEDFTPPAELSTDVPPEFNGIVARAMAKDPWNRYQRGKDLALALYQLKAHLEEQKALEDLGTMVSAAENLPTLKLSNLQELAAMGAPGARNDATAAAPAGPQKTPPPMQRPGAEPTHPRPPRPATAAPSASARPTTASTPTPSPMSGTNPNLTPRDTPPLGIPPLRDTPPLGTLAVSTSAAETPAAPPVSTFESDMPTVSDKAAYESLAAARSPELASETPAEPSRRSEAEAESGAPSAWEMPPLPPPPAALPHAPSQDWKKLAKAEVNPRWFWTVSLAALGIVLLLVGFFVMRARSAARPTAEHDVALEQEVKDRRQALEEGKKLFDAGKYEESLARFRQVLARSPNNQEARQYAQMADNAVTGKQQEQARIQQAAQLVDAAKASLADGKVEQARAKAEEILALDASNADAIAIRDEADKKIVEQRATADVARKKAAKTKEPPQVAAKKAPAVPLQPGTAGTAGTASTQGPASAPVSGPATLRLTFASPIPEGHIMVAVNDQILLRKPFSFKKGEGRTVAATMTIPSGPAAIKAWFSGPNMPSVFATTNAQLNGGDSRTLVVDYAGGGLTVKVQ